MREILLTSQENSSTVGDVLEPLNGPEADEKSGQTGQQFKVGRVLLRRLRRICAVVVKNSAYENVGVWYAGLIAGKLAAEVVYYYAGTLPSEFYRVLGDRDFPAFASLLGRCVVVVGLAGSCKAALEYVSGLIGVVMRQELTRYTHSRYLRAPSFYPAATSSSIDNPDQRITQDIERLTRSGADVLAELLIAPFLIAYYTMQCWSMAGIYGPLAIYIYFGIGAAATRLAMAPIIKQVYMQEQAEGDFRFHHVRTGESAESIAFISGEDRERAAADRALTAVTGTQRRVLGKQLHLGLLTQVFAYMGSTVSYVIIGVPIFMGTYDDKSGTELSSLISVNAFVSIYLIYRFTSVIELTKRMADVAGYATRLVQLWEELDRLDMEAESYDAESGASMCDSAVIVARGLDVCTPNGAQLVTGLDLEIGVQDPLVITGPNGAGKTALLRTLCGLWRPGGGEVQLARSNGALDVFFLPQTPYIIGGSLREQLCYPGLWGGRHAMCYNADIVRILAAVGLSHVADVVGISNLDYPYKVQTWLRLLSPGERQMMSIARVLFWRPKFVMLDECTSALDASAAEALYRAMLDAGITVVSVSHSAHLERFHSRRLHLDGCGGHTIHDIC
ncbi:ATP-binding cassette sub-family D member 4-like protein [Coemansia reversa NRRL 1564]|uniref:ATP-binding cassette sub-family D member 4-like protein n=1 Tax=Coemansia reversa (strain ATCC 12441 / NRRL 1564) TaxID=763665 RepID=A0A2G5B6N7_COERN|nr:ATP-binding cassette sub-family D member 4-like protein [Coemansia reversa NRRL 1564]|eukprot:PIA14668.1 ATP-binding cassette sub-family D member 4-like protein [Coemansia reversa NRRL 1564]